MEFQTARTRTNGGLKDQQERLSHQETDTNLRELEGVLIRTIDSDLEGTIDAQEVSMIAVVSMTAKDTMIGEDTMIEEDTTIVVECVTTDRLVLTISIDTIAHTVVTVTGLLIAEIDLKKDHTTGRIENLRVFDQVINLQNPLLQPKERDSTSSRDRNPSRKLLLRPLVCPAEFLVMPSR